MYFLVAYEQSLYVYSYISTSPVFLETSSLLFKQNNLTIQKVSALFVRFISIDSCVMLPILQSIHYHYFY